jgi:hypothetical protein
MSHEARVSPEELVAAVQQETNEFLHQVAQAVNAAPDGAWIAGSEEPVRDLAADYRRRVFERAVQMRIHAAEAAFSPSEGPQHRQTPGQ